MQEEKTYDVVIVGAGIAGSVLAKEIARQHKNASILILEAGTGNAYDFSDYERYNNQYYNAVYKTPNAPYTETDYAPSPSVMDIEQIPQDGVSDKGYFVQKGPFPFLSNYNRNVGGTTLHWLGTTPRMCPNDFRMKTMYNRAVDWPISYEELKPLYRRAEYEIGVSGDVESQEVFGTTFKEGYVFPMQEIPQSYLDKHMEAGLEKNPVYFAGNPLEVKSSPQGRNGMPNPNYRKKDAFPDTTFKPEEEKGFEPVGAVGRPDLGQRCEGNANCVPICPVQAKYSGMKSLHAVLQSDGDRITLKTQSPVSKIIIGKDNEVEAVLYKTYKFSEDGKRTIIKEEQARGKKFVLAANAIENAKILLASNAANTSDMVGRNLMDHLVLLTWGFFKDNIGAYRGPGSTSGIPTARDGEFRKEHAAFRIEIGNWGWNWPANTPESTITDAVDKTDLYGKALIDYIKDTTSRQFRIGWEVEQLPSLDNRIYIDEAYKDDLGNYRPIISYNINDYEKLAALKAQELSDDLFENLSIQDESKVDPNNPGYFEFKYGENIFKGVFNGAGHVVGTHRMGTCKEGSVVNEHQQSHDHANLFIIGCGSFPTLATSNPTLTMTALTFKTADKIVADLKDDV